MASCSGGHFELGGHSCNPPAPDCPASRPTPGASCYGYGPCGYTDTCVDSPTGASTESFVCTAGTWRSMVEDYVAKCPKTPPVDGSSCACGAHFYGECGYGDCYGSPTTIARCDPTSGRWSVLPSTCNPPPPDADAGPPPDVGTSGEAGSSEAGSGTAEAGHT
jgi:hypothetical protein